MKSTIIAPKESAPTLSEVKRALLTFDKVYLISPDDTDLMPSNQLLSAIGMPPLISMPGNDVRPICRVPNFEEDFSKLEKECELAIKQGLVEVISTYNRSETQGAFIGYVPTGGYPLNCNVMLNVYRKLATNQDLLMDAIKDSLPNLVGEKDLLFNIAKNGSADGEFNINNNCFPALPNIEGVLNDESLRIPITQIARGRIATAIKIAAFCEAKELVPFYTSVSYENIINRLMSSVSSALDNIPDTDKFWERRNRILRVLHNEYLDSAILEKLPFKEVLKLRTKAWGVQASEKTRFENIILELVTEEVSNDTCEKKCLSLIGEYNKLAQEIETERDILKHKLGFYLTGSTIFSSGLSSFTSPIGCLLTGISIVGGLIAPESMKIRAKEKALKNSKSFALCSTFDKINNSKSVLSKKFFKVS